MTVRSSADWPKISIIIGGAQESPATRDTAQSVMAGAYPGTIQLLTGGLGEQASPAAIANAHAAEASGSLLMMLPPGATLDPHCLRRLVTRLLDDDRLPAVAPEWRGPDDSRLNPAGYSAGAVEIHLSLRDLLGTAPATPKPVDDNPGISMLTPTRRFFAAGGYDLRLDGTPYLGADFGHRLADSDLDVPAEAGAVAFAPARTADHQPADLSATARSTAAATRSPDIRPGRHRVLWAADHLPDRNRSGVDARQFEVIESLTRSGADLLVWAGHDNGAHSIGRELTAAGIHWIVPPPDHRWGLSRPSGSGRWLQDLLGSIAWETVVIGEPRLVGRTLPQIRALAPQARTIVDLGRVRLAGDREADARRASPAQIIAGIEDVDGVVVAGAADANLLERTVPGLPAFVFGALGRSSESHASPDGGLLFIGDLFRRPNLLALEWWMDDIAARVEAGLGQPAPLRVAGHGSDAHRAMWDHPSKIEVAGWQPDLAAELDRARLLVVPLTMVTGTGGRIATALAHCVPVVASTPAVATLAPGLADLVHHAGDAPGLANMIAHLMGDDLAWENARVRIASLDISALREAQAASLAEWMEEITPESRSAAGTPTRRRRTRPVPRRRHRAS